MNIKLLVVIVGYLLYPTTPTFASQKIVCPQLVHLENIKLTDDFDSAVFRPAIAPAPLRLTGFNVFDGPPEEGGALKPTTSRRQGKSDFLSWTFTSANRVENWVACDYAGGLIRLAAKVNNTARTCSSLVPASVTGLKTAIKIVCE